MRNESSEITSRAVAYGTAAGASSDRKDDASLPLVGDPPSVVNDSVVDNDGQQQQHEQCEHNNKPASSATEEESRVADETAVDVNSGGNGGGRRIEEVGNPSFVVKDQDGVVNHDGNTPQLRQRQYAKRNKQQPAASASKIVGGQRNLTIDHRRGYKYGVGPTNTSGTPRACTSARFSIEEEIDSAVFEYEAQKPWRDNERKLALEGLEATTSSLQQRHACSSASTSRHQRDRKSNSMVNLAEDTTETRPVAEQEEQLLLLLSGSNGKLPAAKDNITTGSASATVPSSSFREQHYLCQDSIDLPAAIDVTAEISTTITPSSGEEKPLRRDIIGLPPATDMTTGILNKTIPASSLREQHSLRQDIIRLAREDERETALLLSADSELKGAAQAGSRGDPAGAAYLLGAAGVNIIRRVELVDQLVVTASSLADTVESTLLLGAPLRTTTRTSQVHRWSNNTTTNKIFDSSRLQGNVEKKKEIGGGIQGRAERDGENQARGWTREHKSGVGWPHAVQQDTTPSLWSLLIQRCRLPSLMPVAGLLHRLNSLCSLQIHGIVGRFTLNGLERLLSDAPCLRTIALRRCGLTRLPCLESASVETLDVGDNSIKTAAGLEHLFRLTVLNMSGNNICRLMDVLPLVPLGAGCLRVLNLNGNPVQNTLRYRASVVAMVASLRVLDGAPVHRPWGASLSTEETPSRVRRRPVDGYFTDGGGVTSDSRRERQQTKTMRRRMGAETNLGRSGENQGFVRGLAGLGLIWGGVPRDRCSSFGSSNQPRSSETYSYASSSEAGTPRHGGKASLFRSHSAERLFERCKQLAGVGLATVDSSQGRNSRRGRSPSPERCRQIAGDIVRSQPRTDWNTRFRRHQEQEQRVRNIAKLKAAHRSRGGQAARMEQLARPSR